MKLRLPRVPVRILVRIAAVALVAAAIIRAAVALTDTRISRSAFTDPNTTATAPLDRELERCRHLTPEQAGNAACRRAWAESRRRFLGSARQEQGL